MATIEKKIKVNGVQISYYEYGSGNEAVIFIHGFPFNKSMWEEQALALSKSRRVIAFDIRGFGDSEAGSEKFSIDLFGGDLIALIDALGLTKVVACGLSMGGYILMNAVGRAPEKFGRLVFADTQCIADSDEGRQKRFKTIDKVNAEGLEVFADGYVQNIFAKTSLENKKDAVNRAKQMIISTDQDTVTSGLKALAERRESCNNLKQVKIPTLIICGDEDTVTPLSQAELLNNAILGSTLKIIKGAGHMSNLEEPLVFNEALLEFLG